MTRRRFILFLCRYIAGFALLHKAGTLPALLNVFQPDTNNSAIDLSPLFSSSRNAKVIGKRYLSLYPGAHDRSRIIADLGFPPVDPANFNRDTLRSWLNESQQNDFNVGNTVIVDNWILSYTEANLCALIALS